MVSFDPSLNRPEETQAKTLAPQVDIEELRHLAYLAGIWRDHQGPSGERIHAPVAAIQHGLEALGLSVSSTEEIRQRIFELMERRAEGRLSSPLVVSQLETAGNILEVPLVLRPGDPWGSEALEACVETEDGRKIKGHSRQADFLVAGSEKLGERYWNYCRAVLEFEEPLPCGYHSIRINTEPPGDDTERRLQLIVTPDKWYVPPELGRAFGFQVQLPGLRTAEPEYWGVGDFRCLKRFVEVAAKAGAGTVGLSPLHAMPSDRREVSPYSPDHRSLLDPMYICVEDVPEFRNCQAAKQLVESPAFQAQLRVLREGFPMDYPGVWEIKEQVLRLLYQHLLEHSEGSETARFESFKAFCRHGGAALHFYAVHRVMSLHFLAEEPPRYWWREWPEEFQVPHSAAVADFAEKHSGEIGFHKYLQWLAGGQLAEVSRCAKECGLSLGLYRDLALSCPASSAEAWVNQDSLVNGASMGAPPEPAIPAGQNWGGVPLHPDKLRESAFAPVRELLAANMQPDGMLRIDHGMQLQRLYWIPPGCSPEEGVYCAYPLADLMKLIALESHRRRCLVVCEDLGTVDPEFRRAMEAFGAFGYEIQHNDPSKPPSSYRRESVVTGTNHDTPCLETYWSGADIVFRQAAGELFRTEALAELEKRRIDLGLRRELLMQQGLITSSEEASSSPGEVIHATYKGLAQSPAAIVMIPMQDIDENVFLENVPGRRARLDRQEAWPLLFNRRTVPVEELPHDKRFQILVHTMRSAGRTPAR